MTKQIKPIRLTMISDCGDFYDAIRCGSDHSILIGENEFAATSVSRAGNNVKADFVQIIRPVEPAWVGVGLPPVGVPLEYQRRGAPNGKWYPTQINFLSGQHVIFCDSDGDEIRENPGDILFRPIRTPEQILHDEAMEEVPPIYGALVAHGLPRSQEAFDAVLAMWKAGYRKP